jgi:hypothetical protein
MTSLQVPIVRTTGEDAGHADVSIHAENRRCVLDLSLGTLEVSGQGADYFEALCEVRLKLEERGLLVASYGGSRNLFLSGMCRDMGAGLDGYRVTLGKKPGRENLVGIFDTGPDVQPATVAEQRAFQREWLRSIGVKVRDEGPG